MKSTFFWKISLSRLQLRQVEETSLKRRLAALQLKGLYENCPPQKKIHRLTGEHKKVESRIDTLKMREASGADVDLLIKIEKLEKEFGVEYKLYTWVN
jgi:hypothetical protein